MNPGEAVSLTAYDAGKRIKRCQRHIVTDTTGLLVGLQVYSAGILDLSGALDFLRAF